MSSLKIYSVDFDPIWDVPSGLIIAAYSEEQATEIAKATIAHTVVKSVTEIDLTGGPCVIFYESGNY